MPSSEITRSTITHGDLLVLQRCPKKLAFRIVRQNQPINLLKRSSEKREHGLRSYQKGLIAEKTFEGIISGLIECREDYVRKTIREVGKLVKAPQDYDLRSFVKNVKKEISGKMGEKLSIQNIISLGRISIPGIGVMHAVPDYFLEYKNGIKPVEIKNMGRLSESDIFQTRFYHAMSQLFRSDLSLKILVSERNVGDVELFKEVHKKRLLPPAIINLGDSKVIEKVEWNEKFGNFVEQVELAWGVKWLAEKGFIPQVEKSTWSCRGCHYRILCLNTQKRKTKPLEPMKPFHISYAEELNERMGEELRKFLGRRDCDSVRRWVFHKFGDDTHIRHYVLKPITDYEKSEEFDKRVSTPKIVFSALPKEWKTIPKELIHQSTLRLLSHVNLEQKIKTAKNVFKKCF